MLCVVCFVDVESCTQYSLCIFQTCLNSHASRRYVNYLSLLMTAFRILLLCSELLTLLQYITLAKILLGKDCLLLNNRCPSLKPILSGSPSPLSKSWGLLSMLCCTRMVINPFLENVLCSKRTSVLNITSLNSWSSSCFRVSHKSINYECTI